MLTLRKPPWLVLLMAGLVAVGLTITAWVFWGPKPVPLQVDSVAIGGAPGEPSRLVVAGRGLHAGVSALLLPEQQESGSAMAPFNLGIALYQMATDGRLAVVSTRDQRILALDVTPGRQPTVLGGMKPLLASPLSREQSITAIALAGSRAVIGRSNSGLFLVDVSDPAAPHTVDTLKVPHLLLDLQVGDGKVYAAAQEGGLLVVTFAGDQLRSWQVPGSANAWRLAVKGRRLATASQKGELAFYDLDSQGWPHLAGTMKLTEEIRDLALAPDALYICTANGRLQEYALGDWPNPVLSGQLDLSGRPLRLDWDGELRQLACLLVGSGVAIVDVSRRGLPQSAGLIAIPRTPLVQAVSNGRLFLAGLAGLEIFPLEGVPVASTPPPVVHPFAHGKGHVRLFPWQGAVFASNNMGELVLIAGPGANHPRPPAERREAAPVLVLPEPDGVALRAIRDGMPSAEVLGRIPISDPAMGKGGVERNLIVDMAWYGRRLYVLTPSKVSIYDYDRRGLGILVGEVPLPDRAVAMAWLEPGFLVVALSQKGLQLIDVRDPAKPQVAAEYPLARHLRTVGILKDLLVDGHRLYVARARLGVEIFDVTDPAAPQLIQRIDTPGSAGRLSLHNGLLLVTDQDKGVFMIDVQGERALPVGSYSLPVIANEILNNGDSFFVTNATGGVLHFPAPPRPVQAVATAQDRMELSIPAGLAPGRYRLALYDDVATVSYPVKIQ